MWSESLQAATRGQGAEQPCRQHMVVERCPQTFGVAESGSLQRLMLSHGTNTSGQHLKQIDGLAHSALSLESHLVVTRC